MFNCCHSFEECDCDCHRIPGMMHCMPCCGTCPYCQKNIKFLYYDEHVTKCGEAIRQLACNTDNEICDCEYHQLPGRCTPPCCKVCPKCGLHIKEVKFQEHLEKCNSKRVK